MAYVLVNEGAVTAGASGAAVTPAWGASGGNGTGTSRSPGNLLVCTVSVNGSATVATTPSGWTATETRAGTSCSVAIFTRIALGTAADTPTIAAITSGVIEAKVQEWSGVGLIPILDRGAVNSGVTTPLAMAGGGADAATGELGIAVAVLFHSVAHTQTSAITCSHWGTITSANNNGTNSVNHYNHCQALVSTNPSADSVSHAFSTGNLTGVAEAFATLKVYNHTDSTYDTTPQGVTGLQNFWPLDESAGVTVYDSKSNINGSLGGTTLTPTIGVASILPTSDGRTCMSFSRANQQWVSVADNAVLAPSGSFSIEAWVNSSSIGGTTSAQNIIAKTNAYWFAINTAGNWTGGRYVGAAARSILTGNTPVAATAGTHHVVLTFDISTGLMHYYVDGLLLYTESSASTTVTDTTTNPLKIGSWDTVPADSFNGTIEKPALYTVALSLAQVQANFVAGGGSISNVIPRLTLLGVG